MGAKRYSTKRIIVKLREAEIEMGRGVKVPEVCRKLGVSERRACRDLYNHVRPHQSGGHTTGDSLPCKLAQTTEADQSDLLPRTGSAT